MPAWLKAVFVWLFLGSSLLLTGCNQGTSPAASSSRAPDLTLLSGSENRDLEPILTRFEQQNSVRIRREYGGSVDMMLRLENGAPDYDAVWPANSLWIDLGDQQKRVKRQTSIMRSPVVFGVKKSVAERLGWVGKDVKVQQILNAAAGGKLRFVMTSATQSNSGASAYLGYLYALAGHPEVLTHAALQKPALREKIRRFLGAVDRSSGSSGWLKDLFLQQYDRFDAMVNYEALVIEANKALAARGREPLYAVYPVDGLAIADSPLGYVDHGDTQKEALFQKLQAYLLTPDVQREIMATGRRVGLAGLDAQNADRSTFNPEWGVRLDRVLNPIRFPKAEVIREALDLYQTAFRKPSLTVFCLDCSGSMNGRGITDVKSSMHLLLDQVEARKYLLQAAAEDVNVIIPFNNQVLGEWKAGSGSAESLGGLLTQVDSMRANGGTDIYSPVMRGLDLIRQTGKLDQYSPAVILMTDGKSNTGAKFADLQQHVAQLRLPRPVPVYAIMFGEASDAQLKQIAESTSGRVFDGRTDLVKAFREARGYN